MARVHFELRDRVAVVVLDDGKANALSFALMDEVETLTARLLGPDASSVLECLRRAPLDHGLAAEFVDREGRATSCGGDATLSGLVAYCVWFTMHAHGVRP